MILSRYIYEQNLYLEIIEIKIYKIYNNINYQWNVKDKAHYPNKN